MESPGIGAVAKAAGVGIDAVRCYERADVDKRLAELQHVRDGLSSLVGACPGHGVPERRPILTALGGEES